MKVFRVLAYIVTFGCWITAALLGIYIYVGSILGANHSGGIVAAIATAVLPPFAQIYWLIVNWTASGTMTSPYSIACLVWLAAVVTLFLISAALPKD